MFDSNDYLNSLFNNDYSSTTTTDTETTTENQTTYSPQTDYSMGTQTFERDDYSSAQNFTEQQSYESMNTNRFAETEQEPRISQMNTPMIKKGAPVVNLVKSRARIHLETRMKIVLSVFSVVVACLLFVSIFNFISASQLEATFAGKQAQINVLEQSISESKDTYTLVTDDEYIKEWAESENYVVKDESNSVVIHIGEVYEEDTIQEIPSNWFNDVCEFFSKLFA